jgi:YegS/Rv2252/BmrU family lipid kinase
MLALAAPAVNLALAAPAVNQHSVLVIVNPTSRHTPKRDELDRKLDSLRHEGHTFEIAETAGPGEATAIAAQAGVSGFSRVAACGGDGTLNEVLNGVLDRGPAVALLPTGTGNVFAKEVGIPRDLEPAARIAVEGPVRRIDLGSANGRRFILMCGIGFDGNVTARVPDSLKRRLGSLAFIIVGLREILSLKPIHGAFQLDEERLDRDFYIAVVGNSRSYGGVVNITKRAFVDDGLLDVCIMGGSSRLRFARHGLRLALGTHTSAQDIVYRRVRSFSLQTAAVPMQLDGDTFAATPVHIEALPAAVDMVIPDGAQLFAHPRVSPL